MAALLLTWLTNPDAFLEQEELGASLEQREKAELIALIKLMLDEDPDLESLLELPMPGSSQPAAATAEAYAKRAREVFEKAYLDDWQAAEQVASELEVLIGIGDDFRSRGEVTTAAGVYQAVLRAIVEQEYELSDDEGDLGACLDEAVEGIGHCLEALAEADSRSTALQALLDAYMFDVDSGGRGYAEMAPELLLQYAGPAERVTLADQVRRRLEAPGDVWSANWRKEALGGLLLELEVDTLDDEAFLRVCRQTGLTAELVDRLLQLERVDEALVEVAGAEDYAILTLSDLLVERGQGEAAERLILARSAKSSDQRLDRWLAKRYEARGDHEAALRLAEQLFQQQPSLDAYYELRRLATSQTDVWDSLRPNLLEEFRTRGHPSTLLDLYLQKYEVDAAIALLTEMRGSSRGGIFGPLFGFEQELRVAEASAQCRPQAALDIYRSHAEALIEQRNRESYRRAAHLLGRMRALHIELGTLDLWQTYLDDLRARNRNLPALKQELDSAGL